MSGQRYRARRRPELSQHFLRSRALAASLVGQSTISRDDLVLEVGPGQGMLTHELARRCRRLVAVELDERLFDHLSVMFRGTPNVTLIQGDFLEFPLPDSPFKVFANIPFSHTAAIVRRIVNAAAPPEDAYLILQREAAERFAGGPYAPETLQSLLLKPGWQVEISRWLRRTDFEPPPGVDSVVLWLARRMRPLVEASQRRSYQSFIARMFSGDGRSLRQRLRGAFTGRQLRILASRLRFDPWSAPSELTFDQWLGLFRFYVQGRRQG